MKSVVSALGLLILVTGCQTDRRADSGKHRAVDEMLEAFTNRLASGRSRSDLAELTREAAYDRRGPTNVTIRTEPYGIRLHLVPPMPPMPPAPVHPFDVPLPFLPTYMPPHEEPPPLPGAMRIAPGIRIDMAVAASLFR